jgi:hypothetical protein
MKLNFLIISLSLFTYGCSDNEKSLTPSVEEERQKNMAAVIATPVEKTPQPSVETISPPLIPKFVLACSTGTGQPWYRIASNGTVIYYASIVNDNNLRAAKKSYEVALTEREINIKLRSGEDDTTYFMEIDRSSLFVTTKYFVSRQMYPPDGFSEMGLNCQQIEDQQLFETLKNAYEITFSEAVERKRQYDNRPNKI